MEESAFKRYVVGKLHLEMKQQPDVLIHLSKTKYPETKGNSILLIPIWDGTRQIRIRQLFRDYRMAGQYTPFLMNVTKLLMRYKDSYAFVLPYSLRDTNVFGIWVTICDKKTGKALWLGDFDYHNRKLKITEHDPKE